LSETFLDLAHLYRTPILCRRLGRSRRLLKINASQGHHPTLHAVWAGRMPMLRNDFKTTGASALVRRLASLALLVAVAIGGAAVPGHADELWESTLRLQLMDERKCQLERLVFVRELPAPQLGAIEGRARCADGREFDFTRAKAHQKFDIRLCMPTVC
jgi:hypothetical protein